MLKVTLIYGTQILQGIEDSLTFLLADSLANHTALPGSDLEKRMNDTCGHTCLEQFKKLDHVGSWAKTFAGLLVGMGGVVFDEVQTDLESEGYEVLPFLLPACAINAPHRRERIWFVAYTNHEKRERRSGNCQPERETPEFGRDGIFSAASRSGKVWITPNTSMCDKQRERLCEECEQKEAGGCDSRDVTNTCGSGWEECDSSNIPVGQELCSGMDFEEPGNWENFPTVAPVCVGDDGIPGRLDFDAVFAGVKKPRKANTFSRWRNESIKAGGNAIVPQVALQIFKAIEAYNRSTYEN